MIQIALPSLIIRLMFINWVSIFSLFLRLKKKKKNLNYFWKIDPCHIYTPTAHQSQGVPCGSFFKAKTWAGMLWLVTTIKTSKSPHSTGSYYLRHTMQHDLGELQKGFLHFSNKRLSVSFSHKTINVTLK